MSASNLKKTAVLDVNRHYKLVKAKKQLVTLGLTTATAGLGLFANSVLNNPAVHADTVDGNASTGTVATANQVTTAAAVTNTTQTTTVATMAVPAANPGAYVNQGELTAVSAGNQAIAQAAKQANQQPWTSGAGASQNGTLDMTSQGASAINQQVSDTVANISAVSAGNQKIADAYQSVSAEVVKVGGSLVPGKPIDASSMSPADAAKVADQAAAMLNATGSADAAINQAVNSASPAIENAGGALTKVGDINTANDMTVDSISQSVQKQQEIISNTASADAALSETVRRNSAATSQNGGVLKPGSAVNVTGLTKEALAKRQAAQAAMLNATGNANATELSARKQYQASIEQTGGQLAAGSAVNTANNMTPTAVSQKAQNDVAAMSAAASADAALTKEVSGAASDVAKNHGTLKAGSAINVSDLQLTPMQVASLEKAQETMIEATRQANVNVKTAVDNAKLPAGLLQRSGDVNTANNMTPKAVSQEAQKQIDQIKAVATADHSLDTVVAQNASATTANHGVLKPGTTRTVADLTPAQIVAIQARQAAMIKATGQANQEVLSASAANTKVITAAGGMIKQSGDINTANNMTPSAVASLADHEAQQIALTGSLDAAITSAANQAKEAITALSGTIRAGSAINVTNLSSSQASSLQSAQTAMLSATARADAIIKQALDAYQTPIQVAGGSIEKANDINTADDMTAVDVVDGATQTVANISATASADAEIVKALSAGNNQGVTAGTPVNVAGKTSDEINQMAQATIQQISQEQSTNQQLAGLNQQLAAAVNQLKALGLTVQNNGRVSLEAKDVLKAAQEKLAEFQNAIAVKSAVDTANAQISQAAGQANVEWLTLTSGTPITVNTAVQASQLAASQAAAIQQAVSGQQSANSSYASAYAQYLQQNSQASHDQATNAALASLAKQYNGSHVPAELTSLIAEAKATPGLQLTQQADDNQTLHFDGTTVNASDATSQTSDVASKIQAEYQQQIKALSVAIAAQKAFNQYSDTSAAMSANAHGDTSELDAAIKAAQAIPGLKIVQDSDVPTSAVDYNDPQALAKFNSQAAQDYAEQVNAINSAAAVQSLYNSQVAYSDSIAHSQAVINDAIKNAYSAAPAAYAANVQYDYEVGPHEWNHNVPGATTNTYRGGFFVNQQHIKFDVNSSALKTGNKIHLFDWTFKSDNPDWNGLNDFMMPSPGEGAHFSVYYNGQNIGYIEASYTGQNQNGGDQDTKWNPGVRNGNNPGHPTHEVYMVVTHDVNAIGNVHFDFSTGNGEGGLTAIFNNEVGPGIFKNPNTDFHFTLEATDHDGKVINSKSFTLTPVPQNSNYNWMEANHFSSDYNANFAKMLISDRGITDAYTSFNTTTGKIQNQSNYEVGGTRSISVPAYFDGTVNLASSQRPGFRVGYDISADNTKWKNGMIALDLGFELFDADGRPLDGFRTVNASNTVYLPRRTVENGLTVDQLKTKIDPNVSEAIFSFDPAHNSFAYVVNLTKSYIQSITKPVLSDSKQLLTKAPAWAYYVKYGNNQDAINAGLKQTTDFYAKNDYLPVHIGVWPDGLSPLDPTVNFTYNSHDWSLNDPGSIWHDDYTGKVVHTPPVTLVKGQSGIKVHYVTTDGTNLRPVETAIADANTSAQFKVTDVPGYTLDDTGFKAPNGGMTFEKSGDITYPAEGQWKDVYVVYHSFLPSGKQAPVHYHYVLAPGSKTIRPATALAKYQNHNLNVTYTPAAGEPGVEPTKTTTHVTVSPLVYQPNLASNAYLATGYQYHPLKTSYNVYNSDGQGKTKDGQNLNSYQKNPQTGKWELNPHFTGYTPYSVTYTSFSSDGSKIPTMVKDPKTGKDVPNPNFTGYTPLSTTYTSFSSDGSKIPTTITDSKTGKTILNPTFTGYRPFSANYTSFSSDGSRVPAQIKDPKTGQLIDNPQFTGYTPYSADYQSYSSDALKVPNGATFTGFAPLTTTYQLLTAKPQKAPQPAKPKPAPAPEAPQAAPAPVNVSSPAPASPTPSVKMASASPKTPAQLAAVLPQTGGGSADDLSAIGLMAFSLAIASLGLGILDKQKRETM